MRKRTLAREYALKVLYQAEMTHRDIQTATEIFWSEREKIDENVKEFCDVLTAGVAKHLKSIDDRLTDNATNWQLRRMAAIDRNILRLGVFELLFSPDIPPKVAINEAVELAKKYGDLESSKFVNGVIDKIHKSDFKKKDSK